MRNLEERIKIPELTSALSEIFSEYGTIIDIVAKKSLKRRGQAFIVFDSPDAAQRALEEVQGFDLFDKPMQLDYARTRSDATVKAEGTEEELEVHKRRRLAEKGDWLLAHYLNPTVVIKSANPSAIHRAQASSRRRRGTEEAQAARSRCPRARRRPSRQNNPRCRPQVYRRRRIRHSRRVPSAQQDSIRAELARKLRRRCAVGYLQPLRGVQGSAACAWKERYRVRGVRG